METKGFFTEWFFIDFGFNVSILITGSKDVKHIFHA
jgi:hypothetical protein